MKTIYRVTLLVVFVVLGLIGCTKYEVKKTTHDWGEASTNLNGQPWDVKIGGGGIDSKLSIQFSLQNGNYRSPILHFSDILLLTDSQRVYKQTMLSDNSYLPTATAGTTEQLGHGGCEWWDPIEADSVNNWIKLNRIEGKEVWGEFSISLEKTSSCAIGTAPDTLIYRNGKFHVKFP